MSTAISDRQMADIEQMGADVKHAPGGKADLFNQKN